jgi:hypothetical protein
MFIAYIQMITPNKDSMSSCAQVPRVRKPGLLDSSVIPLPQGLPRTVETVAVTQSEP